MRCGATSVMTSAAPTASGTAMIIPMIDVSIVP